MLTRANVVATDRVLITGSSGGSTKSTRSARCGNHQLFMIGADARDEDLKNYFADTIDLVIDLVAGAGWPALWIL